MKELQKISNINDDSIETMANCACKTYACRCATDLGLLAGKADVNGNASRMNQNGVEPW